MTTQQPDPTDAMLGRVAEAIYAALEKAGGYRPYISRYGSGGTATDVAILDGDFDLREVARTLCEDLGIEPHHLRADSGTIEG